MNELVIPPAPHWYKSSMVVCSPDNTLVYGSKNDLVVIKERGVEEPPDIQVIHGAHTKHVASVSLNKKWKQPHSYVVSLGEDNVIKVWNLETFEKKITNKDHVEHKEAVIGAVFAGDDRVVSAASSGLIIVWNINTNESKPLKDLFKGKVNLTCLSSCPHASWLLAFGLGNGCVIIADLRRDGQVLYKLRGHYQSVVSLSWCPAPVNVFPRHTNNKVKNKSDEVDNNDKDLKEKSQQKDEKNIQTDTDVGKEKTKNPWVNLVHADDDDEEVPPKKQEPLSTEIDDFLKDCDNLKNKIMGINISQPETPEKSNSDKDITIKCEEQRVEVEQKLDSGRPLPKLYDPSGDFFDEEENIFQEDEESKSNEKNDDINTTGSVSLEQELDIIQSDESRTKVIQGDDQSNLEEKSTEVLIKQEADAEPKTKDVVQNLDELELSGDSAVVKDETPLTEEEPRIEYLLASSGKDKSIYIWRAGTDGRMQTFFHVSKKGNRKNNNTGTWISTCWFTPDTLLTSSATGELLLWPLPKPKESNKQFQLVHCEHSSIIFNIATPIKYMTSYNWRDKVDSTVWTWSQDGKLLNYDVSSNKIRFSYSTVTSHITCFDSSSLDPNRLAISQRDGGIRIWDLSLPHTKIVTMQKFQQKYTHKVTAIAWHPLKEMILGFGTEEGRVGFIDLSSKKTTLFPHYFRNQVHKVEWGPLNSAMHNLGLYVVSEGKMGIYDLDKTKEDPLLLELPEKLYVYKFAWKPDFGLLLLNGKDGSLEILGTDLKSINTFYPSEKGLNGIVWHPDAFTNKTDISPRCNWFAATTTKGVLVFDCASIQENDHLADKIIVLFEGHLRPPLALAWCSFDGNRIVSTAADGLAHVWDVTTKSVISTFVDNQFSHNPAVAWSPVDPDLIIMGDRFIRIWSISKNPPKIDEEFMTARKRLLGKAPKNDSEKSHKNKIKVEIPPKGKSNPRNCIVPSFYVSNDENITIQVDNMRKLMNNVESGNFSDNDIFQIFGSKEQVTNLLDTNYHQQKKDGKVTSCELISVFKGNVGEYIQEAINENRVTPTVITLAPMVSPKLWQDACLTYAKKLTEDSKSDPLETAMYFLACHKIEEAINCLCVGLMYKEALALAKHRLLEGSELIIKVTERWAEHSVNTGNFENAAYCYISIKQYENAAKVLARRNHIEVLEFAAELAVKEGNTGLYDSIKFKCTELQESNDKLEENIASRVDALLKNIGSIQENGSMDDKSQSETEHGSVETFDEISSNKVDTCENEEVEREV